MTMTAKTEAEAFLKLQEAATRAPWRYCEAGAIVFGPTDNEHIADAVIDIRGYGADLPMDANGRFVAYARNTALPRLTLEVAAENEKLTTEKEGLRKLVDALWNYVNDRRCELIERDHRSRALTITESEDLEKLQSLCSLLQNTLAPLPIKELESLAQALQEPTR